MLEVAAALQGRVDVGEAEAQQLFGRCDHEEAACWQLCSAVIFSQSLSARSGQGKTPPPRLLGLEVTKVLRGNLGKVPLTEEGYVYSSGFAPEHKPL